MHQAPIGNRLHDPSAEALAEEPGVGRARAEPLLGHGPLGREVEQDETGAFLRAAADGGPSIYVNRVPEPKTVKDRVHLDVTLEPGQQIADLLALGATVVTEAGDVPWWVLADPEGHEFCAFLPDADATNDADAEVPA